MKKNEVLHCIVGYATLLTMFIFVMAKSCYVINCGWTLTLILAISPLLVYIALAVLCCVFVFVLGFIHGMRRK